MAFATAVFYSGASPDSSEYLGYDSTLRFFIARSCIGGGAVRTDIRIAGFAALDAGRPRHGPGAKFHRDCHTDLLADGKAADPAVPGADISRRYDRLTAAVRDRRAHVRKGGHRHRHTDGGSLISDHRAAAALLCTRWLRSAYSELSWPTATTS